MTLTVGFKRMSICNSLTQDDKNLHPNMILDGNASATVLRFKVLTALWNAGQHLTSKNYGKKALNRTELNYVSHRSNCNSDGLKFNHIRMCKICHKILDISYMVHIRKGVHKQITNSEGATAPVGDYRDMKALKRHSQYRCLLAVRNSNFRCCVSAIICRSEVKKL